MRLFSEWPPSPEPGPVVHGEQLLHYFRAPQDGGNAANKGITHCKIMFFFFVVQNLLLHTRTSDGIVSVLVEQDSTAMAQRRSL